MTPDPEQGQIVGPSLTRLRIIRRVASVIGERHRPPGLTGDEAKAHYHRWEAAVAEALTLVTLESRGCVTAWYRPCSQNCREIGDVLDVPAAHREALRAFVAKYPEELAMVEEALQFRAMVCTSVEWLRLEV